MHTPVFHDIVIDLLAPTVDTRLIDATVGEGGHTESFLQKGASVLAVDQDSSQVQSLRVRYKDCVESGKLTVVHGNFRNLVDLASQTGFIPCNGILADLGLSMKQLQDSGLGLSYKALDDPLDMRFDDQRPPASRILQLYSYEQLNELFSRWGEDLYADQFAHEIVATRKTRKPNTVERFNEIIETVLRRNQRTSREDFQRTAARLYQALRIEVNDEIGNLKEFMRQSGEILAPGGMLIIITFHSTEDRIVKMTMRNRPGWKAVKVSIRVPERKRFERSAQLRVYTKL